MGHTAGRRVSDFHSVLHSISRLVCEPHPLRGLSGCGLWILNGADQRRDLRDRARGFVFIAAPSESDAANWLLGLVGILSLFCPGCRPVSYVEAARGNA